MSFRADRIRHIAFDSRASDCQCEDFDYCLLLDRGAELAIVPGARLMHMTSPKEREDYHWIRRSALSYAFLFQKHFALRWADRLRFGWLCVGLGLVATIASLRRLSSEPWRTCVNSLREGFSAARQSLSAGR